MGPHESDGMKGFPGQGFFFFRPPTQTVSVSSCQDGYQR